MPPAESQTLKNLAAKRAATKNPTTPMVTGGTNHIENVRKEPPSIFKGIKQPSLTLAPDVDSLNLITTFDAAGNLIMKNVSKPAGETITTKDANGNVIFSATLAPTIDKIDDAALAAALSGRFAGL